MEANNFITKLKANGSDSDNYDINASFDEYLEILTKLSPKDKGTFSLNVLCILCRNLDKVPKWRDTIDTTKLLKLGIECIRHTRMLDEMENQVKTLACTYHIHKYIIKQTSPVPPELVLKLSFMPFEFDESDLLKNYCKTYWSILCDRMTYIEKLKALKMPIVKLLNKLTEDVVKTIKIYETVQFCTNLLQFLIKKLHFIFNDWPKELNDVYGKIFECISKKDLNSFKSLSEKECMDLFVKLNDLLYIVADNSLNDDFSHSVLGDVVRVCISMLGHRPDIFHCFQTFYLNAFCCIYKEETNSALVENILSSLALSFDMTEKLGYKHTMHSMYPFISQLLRLFIESIVYEEDCENYFNGLVQEKYLILIKILAKKLENTRQLMKCENCRSSSGVHDALRLSFLVKHFVSISADKSNSFWPIYLEIVESQYSALKVLKRIGCCNESKYARKLQTDVHNTAILLNKYQYYGYSIKLFEIYVENELRNVKSDGELKNVSRALYNKSICELDHKMYAESLQNAYLSLIFSLPEGLNTDKYMNLVIDIKSKALKSVTEDENNDLQMMSVLDVSKLLYDSSFYGNLKPFMKNLEFSTLLKHEFSMYIKLWPSIVPVAGVWRSLHELVSTKNTWVKAENEDLVLWSLYDVILETPLYVRTIHNDCFKHVVEKLLDRFDETTAHVQSKVVLASLLFLKAEYDIADASVKYGWKVPPTADPEQVQVNRTIEQEHKALAHAFRAVDVLTDVLPYLKTEKISACILKNSLQLYQVFVQQLLFMHSMFYGLHLACICIEIAEICGDRPTYVRNATVLTSFMSKKGEFEPVMLKAAKYCGQLMKDVENVDVALDLLCEMACYYEKCGKISLAAKLVETVQKRLLYVQESSKDVDVSLSMGSLMYAQYTLRPDSGLSTLSALNAIQRHHLASASDCPRWAPRRVTTLAHIQRSVRGSILAASNARALRVWRRAKRAAAPISRLSSRDVTRLVISTINCSSVAEAQIKIDSRLRFYLGLQSATDLTHSDTQKQQLFTPKQTNLETMRDCMFKKNETSPSLPLISIPAFRIPEFFSHKACSCSICDPCCTILACCISSLESSTYFKAKETDIAKNYFTGTLQMFEAAEAKMKRMYDSYRTKFHTSVVNSLKEMYGSDFRHCYVEFLIEYAYFLLSVNEFKKSDEVVVKIHEILSGAEIDGYLTNELHNLMVATSRVRRNKANRTKLADLEVELENLKLSPAKETVLEKTPESKVMPKIDTLKIVKDEELPKKRKVIKLNLDETSSDEVEKAEKMERPKPRFKIPVPKPVLSKPTLETITPRRTRSKPDIVVQKPSFDEDLEHTSIQTPKSTVNESQFFTPCQSTPAEQFFTPMTSLKTYSKKIVKNLESEFSTPKTNLKTKVMDSQRKAKVESGSVKTIKDKRTLKRNTSPGKLVDEKPISTRPRRIRQPALTDK